MFHYIAKIGRNPSAKLVVPTIGLATAGTYYSIHTILHDQIRNLFAAYSPSGVREPISDRVKTLVSQVVDDVSDELCKPFFIKQNILGNLKSSLKLKWFSSSTLEPVTFGSTEQKTGVLIGVPSFFNYETTDEIPDHVFEIKKIKLFRSAQDLTAEDEERAKERELRQAVASETDNKSQSVVGRIDRNSPEGIEFSETLILSDDAIKFCIARELFLADSYREPSKFALICVSFAVVVGVSRGMVKLLKWDRQHVQNRLLIYALSGTLAIGNYRFLADTIDQFHAKRANDRALKVNEAYKKGAEEYWSKRSRRKEILERFS